MKHYRWDRNKISTHEERCSGRLISRYELWFDHKSHNDAGNRKFSYRVDIRGGITFISFVTPAGGVMNERLANDHIISPLLPLSRYWSYPSFLGLYPPNSPFLFDYLFPFSNYECSHSERVFPFPSSVLLFLTPFNFIPNTPKFIWKIAGHLDWTPFPSDSFKTISKFCMYSNKGWNKEV